ncbi:MAG: hypothetical protein WBF21_11175 [Steroidobacteraceae bacterium]
MSKIRGKIVDYNSILMGLNFVVACLIASRYSQVQGSDYIDQQTIVLGVLLSLQTHIALLLERRRRDPFVILLSFTTILYFSLRLFTLALYPFSVVFLRYSYGPKDSNYALIFMLIANCFLYAGFRCVGFRKNTAIDSHDWRPRSPFRVIVLMLISLAYSYFSAIYWTPEEVPRVVDFIGIFISPPIILLMALSYFILYRRTLDRKPAIAIAVLIGLEILAHTLAGSRSGITTLIQNIMLAVLAISSCIRIRRKYFILGCVLAPFVLVVLIGTFAISTFNRGHRDGEATLSLSQAVGLAGQAFAELSANSELEIVLPPVFDRAGFFDYSAEIIAHRDIYKQVFNLSTYAKSIIDNLLTPGFDVYDQPKIANTLQFVYQDLGEPSKEEVTEQYQSDQFGIYGELYGLFAYASLPLFFLIAFLLKRVYVRLRSENPFTLAMKRLIVLSVFVKIVDSYGMDWTIIETIPFVVAIYLYKYLFRSRPVFIEPDSGGSRSGGALPGPELGSITG